MNEMRVIIDDAKQSMKKLKKELKMWEHEFVEANNRKPSKKDIAALHEIGKSRKKRIIPILTLFRFYLAAKYKAYAKLKNATSNHEDEEPAAGSERNIATDGNSQSIVNTRSSTSEIASPSSIDAVATSLSGNMSNLPELPSSVSTAKSKRYQVGDAPISKADIGQKVDRFAKLVQERQAKNHTSMIGNY